MAAFPDDDLTDDDDFPELSFMGAVLVLSAGLLFEMLFIAGSAYVCNWIYERHFLPLTGYPLTYSTFVAVQVVCRLQRSRGPRLAESSGGSVSRRTDSLDLVSGGLGAARLKEVMILPHLPLLNVAVPTLGSAPDGNRRREREIVQPSAGHVPTRPWTIRVARRLRTMFRGNGRRIAGIRERYDQTVCAVLASETAWTPHPQPLGAVNLRALKPVAAQRHATVELGLEPRRGQLSFHDWKLYQKSIEFFIRVKKTCPPLITLRRLAARLARTEHLNCRSRYSGAISHVYRQPRPALPAVRTMPGPGTRVSE